MACTVYEQWEPQRLQPLIFQTGWRWKTETAKDTYVTCSDEMSVKSHIIILRYGRR